MTACTPFDRGVLTGRARPVGQRRRHATALPAAFKTQASGRARTSRSSAFSDRVELMHEQLRLGYSSGEFSDPELRDELGIALGEGNLSQLFDAGGVSVDVSSEESPRAAVF